MLNKVMDIVTIVILTVLTAIGGYIVSVNFMDVLDTSGFAGLVMGIADYAIAIVVYFAFTCKVLKEHKG